MSPSIHVEPQGAHQYVVHLRDGEDEHEAWFHLTPDALEQLQVDEDGEEACVRRTTEFLLQHQDVADFPDIVELEDVMATYDGYTGFVQAQSG